MAWNTVETQAFSDISASTGSFVLRGGAYGVAVNATWGGGSVTLQRLSNDGSTWITVLTAFSDDGYAAVNLPAGTYRLTVATATAIYCEITSIVTTQ